MCRKSESTRRNCDLGLSLFHFSRIGELPCVCPFFRKGRAIARVNCPSERRFAGILSRASSLFAGGVAGVAPRGVDRPCMRPQSEAFCVWMDFVLRVPSSFARVLDRVYQKIADGRAKSSLFVTDLVCRWKRVVGERKKL